MRLVDADAFVKAIDGNPFTTDSVKSYIRVSVAKMPTIEERKTGEWIDGYKRQTCSVCKQRGYRSWNFCPNCGSYNGGDKDDQR